MSFRFNQGDRPLPGYTIQRGVGRGGFGEVYYSLSDGGKEVALKYLRENPQVELRGATHCLNLKSPYLIALHDIKQSAAGEFFVIMEYVNGVSLRDLMNEEPRGLGVQKAAYFAREIAKGLAYLHDRGIVHRDLKPGNIFYEDGYVKIGDYGLSKMMAASQHSGQTVSVGTVHYMAPEVGSGNYDRTIDIYALGVILYEMLLGRVPFSGSSMGEVLMKHLTASPEVDELPAPFPSVIRKALAKDPQDRYQTVNEMIADLFEVGDLGRSVAAFEPASITLLAANAAKKIAAGAHGGAIAATLGTDSSNVGQFNVPPPVIPGAADPRFAAEGFQNVAYRDPAKAALAPAGRAPGSATQEPQLFFNAHAGIPLSGPWLKEGRARALLSLAACAAAAGAATILKGRGFEFWAGMFFHGFAILQAMFLWQWWTTHYPKVDRDGWTAKLAFILIASFSVKLVNELTMEWGLFLSGGYNLPGPLVASFILCDWKLRLDEGRKGSISFGNAVWLAAFGFIAAKIGEADEICIMAILAGASIGVQALGALWPIQPKPRTASRSQSNATPFAQEPRMATAVSNFDATVAVSRDGLPNAAPPAALPYAPRPQTSRPSLPERQPGARMIWFLVTAACLLGMVLCFIAIPTMELWRRIDDFVAALVGGVVLANASCFSFCCAVPRFKKGLWRGIFRKAVFFGGSALVASLGIAIGNYNLHGEELFGALAGILLGASASLFVWFIPVPMPSFLQEAKAMALDDETAARAKKARWMRSIGLGLWACALVLVPILLLTVSEHEWDEVFPATMIPLGVTGMALIGGSFAVNRPKPKEKKEPPPELPIKRSFRVESVTHLRRVLERYAFLHNYRLDSHGEMLWRFLRGDWTAQFWQSDVRKWKTELNVIAYEDGQGAYRTTCQLDIDARFNDPDATMLKKLAAELDDLQAMLESGSSAGREIVV